VWAQAELRKVLAATGARVVEGEVAVGHAHDKLAADGTLTDENLREQLAEVVAGLVESARMRTAAIAA
jgi:chromate reductase